MCPLFEKRWRTGLLFVLLLVAIPKTFAALVLTTPEHKSEGYPYSEMGLWWKYDEDPQVAAEIEEQVEWVGLRLYETDDPDVYKTPKFSDYVGRCRLYDICWSCSLEFETKFRQSRTFASTAECGEELKPNQWYKWSVWVERDGASPLAKAGAFKTGDYRDIIIDDSDAGFTQSGPGPFSERGRGYNNTSLLVNTTWEENDNNNYCQWEWTIPEEGDYEVSVYMPIKFFSGSRMGSSKQAWYKLWREGIQAPRYKSSKIIDQTRMIKDLWMSLGTFHFKAGQAKLRVTDNTGESSPLGRQLLCDAVRVRARLGIPQIISQGVKTPKLRRGVRSPAIPSVFAPRNWEMIPSNVDQVGFRWSQVSRAAKYQLQISTQKFDDSVQENKETSCEAPCFSVLTSEPNHQLTPSQLAPNTPYYWRVRSEITYLPLGLLHDFSQWSPTRQFSVIEAPTAGGDYPVRCREFKEPKGIQFYEPLTKQWTAGGPYNIVIPNQPSQLEGDEANNSNSQDEFGEENDSQLKSEPPLLESMAAWAQICYPVVGNQPLNQMPIALLLAGNFPNCKLQEQGKEAGYFDWEGKLTPDNVVVVPPGPCPEDKIIRSHRGFDYLLEELASHGIFAISINPHEIQGHNMEWNFLARAELILQFIDKLEAWNENGSDPFGASQGQRQDGIFQQKLDMQKILLVGHSRGGKRF